MKNEADENGGLHEADCISFYIDKGEHKRCSALKKPYCTFQSKPCAFRTPREMPAAGRLERANREEQP